MILYTDHKRKVKYIKEYPRPPLDLFVDYFFYLQVDGNTENSCYIFPAVAPKLLQHLTHTPIIIQDNKFIPLNEAYFFGPNCKAHQSQFKEICVRGCKFHPWGLYALMKKDLTQYVNTRFDVDNIFDNKEFLQKPTFSQFVDGLSKVLMHILASGFLDKNISLLMEICNKSNPNIEGKQIELEEILETMEIGKRHFQRIFKQYTGLTYSQYFKVKRLQKLLKHKLTHPSEKLSTLVYDYGYFDQSHFNRDFKSVVGVSPSTFFNDDFIPISHHFFMMDV